MASISRTRVIDADTSNMDMPHDVEQEAYSSGVPDYDTEEEAPRSRPARTSLPVKSGWGAPKTETRERVQAPYLKLAKNGKRIVKLLTDEPSLRYFEHFVNSSGNRYICPGKDTCPLCEAGHRAGYRYMMNVVDMAKPEEVATWTFGNEVAQQLQAFADEPVTSPLSRENLYFHIYHIEVPGRKAPGTKVIPMKARDVYEDYETVPLTEEEIASLSETLYGEETLWIWHPSKVVEAAQNLTPKDTAKND